jgi:hypothetical protein
MITQWLPHYQKQIESHIHGCFDARYNSTEPIEITFEEAMRHAVE